MVDGWIDECCYVLLVGFVIDGWINEFVRWNCDRWMDEILLDGWIDEYL